MWMAASAYSLYMHPKGTMFKKVTYRIFIYWFHFSYKELSRSDCL